MTPKKLKEQFDEVVRMFYERFISYDQLDASEPEKDYRFGIKVWLGDDPEDEKRLQEIVQTKALRGADKFMTQIERAAGMNPAFIEIIEYDKNRKAVPDSGAKLQMKPFKRKRNVADEPESDEPSNTLSGHYNTDAGKSDFSYQLKMMGIENKMTLELQKKDFEIKDLTRQRDELQRISHDQEKEIDRLEDKINSKSLGSVLSGFLENNPALVSGALSGITGMAKTQISGAGNSGALSGLTGERAQVMQEVTEMVGKFSDEQFMEFYVIMSAFNTNPQNMTEIAQYLQPDENEPENSQTQQQSYEHSGYGEEEGDKNGHKHDE